MGKETGPYVKVRVTAKQKAALERYAIKLGYKSAAPWARIVLLGLAEFDKASRKVFAASP